MKKTIKDYNYEGKKVIVRCDFNVPLKNGEITDDNRIVAALPTIKYLIEQNAVVILMSHLGRPKGQPNEEYTLFPVAKRLSKLLNDNVHFLKDDRVASDEVKAEIDKAKPGTVFLLENTRFRPEEEKNGEEFAKELASLADYYVNDAFGTSHRAHASNVGVSKLLPSALGFLVQKEVEIMGKAIENPERPFVAILGGAKVSDKIGVINNLLDIVDKIVIVGAMANTFLKAQGKSVGKSLVEDDKLELANELLASAKAKNVKLILPMDVVVATEISDDAEFKTVSVDDISDDVMALDIGEKSIKEIQSEIADAKTVVWNGPAGVFEIDNFNKGTFAIAESLSKLDAITIVGGGDSAAAIEKAGLKDAITHVSTGGGASLELLEGKVLPGIAAIADK
ncbi:MAG: phosphoglycerate kinase [Tissierellia bacterium]|nr:phosphoglycerate kinase [Tissierellia bacterium]